MTIDRDEQYKRIHRNQDKLNCYIEEGDLIEVHYNKEVYIGEITDIGVRIQTGTDYDGIHPCITIRTLDETGEISSDDSEYLSMHMFMFWMNDIEEIKVLRLGECDASHCK